MVDCDEPLLSYTLTSYRAVRLQRSFGQSRASRAYGSTFNMVGTAMLSFPDI